MSDPRIQGKDLAYLTYIVFLGEFLVSEELGVHSSSRNILGSLGLLDTVGMGLVGVVVCASVLLLLFQDMGKRREG